MHVYGTFKNVMLTQRNTAIIQKVLDKNNRFYLHNNSVKLQLYVVTYGNTSIIATIACNSNQKYENYFAYSMYVNYVPLLHYTTQLATYHAKTMHATML